MRVRGHASTDRLNLRNCIFMPGCFDMSIERAGVDGIAFRLDHQPALPAGKIKQLRADAKGHLWCEALLDPALPHCAPRIRAIRQGLRYGFSVGGYMTAAQTREADGATLIYRFFLTEISLTETPGNPDCFVERAPSLPDDLQEVLDEQAGRRPIKIDFPAIRYHEEAK